MGSLSKMNTLSLGVTGGITMNLVERLKLYALGVYIVLAVCLVLLLGLELEEEDE